MKRIFLFSALLWLISYNVYAQVELSVEECRRLALENSNDLRIATYQYEMTMADQQAVRSAFFPKFEGTATYAYVFKDIDMGMDFDLTSLGLPITIPIDMELSLKGVYLAGIALQQPVFVGGKIVTGNKMAKKGVEITGENVRLTEMNTLLEAEKTYWMYVSVTEKVKLLEHYNALLDSLYQHVSNFYEFKMATENDLQKIRTKQTSIAYEYQRAKSGLELIRMSLCHLTGLDLNTPILATDTAINPMDHSIDNTYDITNRPEYRMLRKQVEIKELAIKNTRADFLPMVGVSAGYTYVGGIKYAGNEMNMGLPMVLASVNVPLFHFGEGSKKVKSARIARDISQAEFNKNSELMNIEIHQAYTAYQSAYLLIVAAREGMKEAEKNLKQVQDNYELKMATVFDVIEAQSQWQEAYSNDIEARTNYKISEIEYLKAIGILE